MTVNITNITDEEIIGVETRKVRIPINKIKDYLSEHGFKYNGVWYFRSSWMNQEYFRLLKESSLVEKVGIPSVLMSMGIKIPDRLYSGGRGPPLIYQVTNDKINSI